MPLQYLENVIVVQVFKFKYQRSDILLQQRFHVISFIMTLSNLDRYPAQEGSWVCGLRRSFI